MSKYMPNKHYIVGLSEMEMRLLLCALKTCSPAGGGSDQHTLLLKLLRKTDIAYWKVPYSAVPLGELASYMNEIGMTQCTAVDLHQWAQDLRNGSDFVEFFAPHPNPAPNPSN